MEKMNYYPESYQIRPLEESLEYHERSRKILNNYLRNKHKMNRNLRYKVLKEMKRLFDKSKTFEVIV